MNKYQKYACKIAKCHNAEMALRMHVDNFYEKGFFTSNRAVYSLIKTWPYLKIVDYLKYNKKCYYKVLESLKKNIHTYPKIRHR